MTLQAGQTAIEKLAIARMTHPRTMFIIQEVVDPRVLVVLVIPPGAVGKDMPKRPESIAELEASEAALDTATDPYFRLFICDSVKITRGGVPAPEPVRTRH